jgi:tetratricopeptide (TPR) repeat protein
MRALLVVLVAAALASAGAVASAQKGTCPAKAQAKRAFDAGHLAYRRGTYEEAILKFQDSYGLCEMPLTLLAIANAYERLGDFEAALEHLEKYRPHAAKGEQTEIDTRIATLKGRIDEEQKEAKRKEEQEQKETKRREEEEARRKAEEIRATEESADQPLWWAGWIAGGVGVVALGGSVVTGALALSLDGDLSAACVDGRCPPDRGEDIDQLGALSTATDVLLVLGATLTASGIAMLLLDSTSDSAPSAELALGPGGASLRGSF